MKVETSFTIDGNIVTKAFEGQEFIIYEEEDECTKVVYLIYKGTGTVALKQVIHTEYGQATGYVEKMEFKEFPV